MPSRDIKVTGASNLPGGNPINRSAYGLLHTLFYTFNQNWCNLLPGVHLLPRLFGCNRYLAQTFIKSKKGRALTVTSPRLITATVLRFGPRRLLPAPASPNVTVLGQCSRRRLQMQLFSSGNLSSGVGTCPVSSKQEGDKVSNKLVTRRI